MSLHVCDYVCVCDCEYGREGARVEAGQYGHTFPSGGTATLFACHHGDPDSVQGSDVLKHVGC